MSDIIIGFYPLAVILGLHVVFWFAGVTFIEVRRRTKPEKDTNHEVQ